MRWVRERAEPLLQLRCIKINGDWSAFIRYVHARAHEQAVRDAEPMVLRSRIAGPLPEVA